MIEEVLLKKFPHLNLNPAPVPLYGTGVFHFKTGLGIETFAAKDYTCRKSINSANHLTKKMTPLKFKKSDFVFIARTLAVVLIMVPAFCAGPFTSLARGETTFTLNGKPLPEVVASVNGTDISSEILKRELSVFRELWAQRGQKVSPGEQEKVAQEIINNAIDDELLYQKGVEMKVVVDPKIIDKELQQIRDKFPSKDLFLAALAFQHLNLDVLKTKIEKKLTEEEFVRMELAPKVKVDDVQTREFYEANKKKFTTPESVEISHIFITGPDAQREGKTEDPADQKRADRLMALIAQEARDEIDKVSGELKKGADFAALAKKYSEDTGSGENGGLLEPFPIGSHLPVVNKALESMKPGQVSKTLKSSYGYHIVKLHKRIQPKLQKYSDVKSDILNILLRLEVKKKKKSYLDDLKKKSDVKIFL